jgi:hypothetical protein
MKRNTMKNNFKKVLIQDKYNHKKTWEINYISHGLYLKQFIYGKQYGRGCRVSMKWLKELGLLDMQPLKVIIVKNK